MTIERRVGIVRLSAEAIRELLKLPDGTLITGVKENNLLGLIDIRVEHEHLRPIEEGCSIPVVVPMYRRWTPVPERVEFVGWEQSGRQS